MYVPVHITHLLIVKVPRKENVSKFANNLDILSYKPHHGMQSFWDILTKIAGLLLLNDHSPISNEHPESDSFNYIKHIVLALRSLSQVHRAMDTITQRLPLEVYQLVDKTIIEVGNRHSLNLRNFGSTQRYQHIFNDFGKSDAKVLSSDPGEDVISGLKYTFTIRSGDNLV